MGQPYWCEWAYIITKKQKIKTKTGYQLADIRRENFAGKLVSLGRLRHDLKFLKDIFSLTTA